MAVAADTQGGVKQTTKLVHSIWAHMKDVVWEISVQAVWHDTIEISLRSDMSNRERRLHALTLLAQANFLKLMDENEDQDLNELRVSFQVKRTMQYLYSSEVDMTTEETQKWVALTTLR